MSTMDSFNSPDFSIHSLESLLFEALFSSSYLLNLNPWHMTFQLHSLVLLATQAGLLLFLFILHISYDTIIKLTLIDT
jgi:hypothetical protein